MFISCINVGKAYGSSQVFRDISFTLNQGESLAVVGPSGVGKTTLLKIVGLIDRPSSGKVIIKGIDTSALGEDELARLRRLYIGYAFQEPTFIPALNVMENILIPLYPWKRWSEIKAYKERATRILSALGLSGIERRRPGDLSTGQRKRVELVRAVIKDPEIIIADEPTANLDEDTAEIVRSFLKTQIEEGKALIFSVHTDQKLLNIATKRIILSAK